MTEARITIPWGALVSDNRRNQRKGGRGHGWDYIKAREVVGTIMAAQFRGEPFTEQVAVRYAFHKPDLRRRDCSNFLKLLGDAGNGIVWKDDSLIGDMSYQTYPPDGTDARVEMTVSKRRAA